MTETKNEQQPHSFKRKLENTTLKTAGNRDKINKPPKYSPWRLICLSNEVSLPEEHLRGRFLRKHRSLHRYPRR